MTTAVTRAPLNFAAGRDPDIFVSADIEGRPKAPISAPWSEDQGETAEEP